MATGLKLSDGRDFDEVFITSSSASLKSTNALTGDNFFINDTDMYDYRYAHPTKIQYTDPRTNLTSQINSCFIASNGTDIARAMVEKRMIPSFANSFFYESGTHALAGNVPPFSTNPTIEYFNLVLIGGGGGGGGAWMTQDPYSDPIVYKTHRTGKAGSSGALAILLSIKREDLIGTSLTVAASAAGGEGGFGRDYSDDGTTGNNTLWIGPPATGESPIILLGAGGGSEGQSGDSSWDDEGTFGGGSNSVFGRGRYWVYAKKTYGNAGTNTYVNPGRPPLAIISSEYPHALGTVPYSYGSFWRGYGGDGGGGTYVPSTTPPTNDDMYGKPGSPGLAVLYW